MEKEMRVSKVDEDEYFEFDTEGDLTSLIFD
jgi:hypothetical protein